MDTTIRQRYATGETRNYISRLQDVHAGKETQDKFSSKCVPFLPFTGRTGRKLEFPNMQQLE